MSKDDITVRAREIARCLTYNDDTAQARAKHVLLEMAHRLDAREVRAHRKKDGLLLINGLGKSRFATLKERVLFLCFGIIPREV